RLKGHVVSVRGGLADVPLHGHAEPLPRAIAHPSDLAAVHAGERGNQRRPAPARRLRRLGAGDGAMSARSLERVRAGGARRLRRAGNPAVSAGAQAGAGEPPAAPPREELERLVRTHGPWYQRIYLGRGVHTLDWAHAAYHESVWAALSPVWRGG